VADQTVISAPVVERKRTNARRIARGSLSLFDHWVLVFSILYGAAMIAPFLAPVLMHLGWYSPAKAVYTIYSFLCHQMAQRSFFMFGPQPMYNIDQLPVTLTGNEVANMQILREFIGSPGLGWKVAWSDRMVSMYGAIWVFGMVYGWFRHHRTIRPLGWIGFGALLLPMAIDGGTHWLSDIGGGMVSGFRYDNLWLANLTGNALPHWFYYGDALGSFNSWMRLITGVLFGLGFVWLAFPYMDRSFREAAMLLREKLGRASARDAMSAA
jgi:uncharacterized membrane protein